MLIRPFLMFPLMRLDKFFCKSTDFSPLEALEHIKGGNVQVNGKTVTNEAAQVHENNTIIFEGARLITRDFRYILMHKPANTICSNIDEAYPSLFHYLDIEDVSTLHIAGRLDADTTGMVLITDDGRWSFNITAPSKKCEKVYRVNLSSPLAENVSQKFKNGIKLQGEQKLTKPAFLDVINSQEVLLTLTEGKFHQVKRMFAAVGNRVIHLHREKIGEICLDVGVGAWRYLSEKEVHSFKP